MRKIAEMLTQTGFQGFLAKIAEMLARRGFQGFLSLLPNKSIEINRSSSLSGSRDFLTLGCIKLPLKHP
jgi:hypothetical protein